MSSGVPAGIAMAMAVTALTAYAGGWLGLGLAPWTAVAAGAIAGLVSWLALARDGDADTVQVAVWATVASAVVAALIWMTWPDLLPPGGASDLTHHLMLVDVIERTGRLADGATLDAALGEMAHYTPGLHLLIVIAGSVLGVEAWRMAYPLLALTVGLKAGFLFLIASDALRPGRAVVVVPLAIASLGFVLLAPRAYSLDGFLQAGFYAQVVSELFAVAGWWALARWWLSPRLAWTVVVGIMGAAVFLTWPIWAGPLTFATVGAVMLRAGLSPRARLQAGLLSVMPPAIVAAMHVSRHAAWLGMAGTSGAVPSFSSDPLAWILVGSAAAGAIVAAGSLRARVTILFAAGIALQGLALWALASARGAETPYMAIKMVYLGVYPAAVLSVVFVCRVLARIPMPRVATWSVAVLVTGAGLVMAASTPLPPPIVTRDLDAAGRWARSHLPPACVDYIVDNAEQAYWLHLAVMGQPRSSRRTADLDGYTSNRAVGRWLEGAPMAYAVAQQGLLPGELTGELETLARFGDAVVVARRGVVCHR